jgi:hypothetical protein
LPRTSLGALAGILQERSAPLRAPTTTLNTVATTLRRRRALLRVEHVRLHRRTRAGS